mmetsp:Transcript_7607/g.16959  ORF Transcript_7607/g.16959 Transcript_7607/m.16959 type:complete len:224 (+) Transcript_7607:758-1429(+)
MLRGEQQHLATTPIGRRPRRPIRPVLSHHRHEELEGNVSARAGWAVVRIPSRNSVPHCVVGVPRYARVGVRRFAVVQVLFVIVVVIVTVAVIRGVECVQLILIVSGGEAATTTSSSSLITMFIFIVIVIPTIPTSISFPNPPPPSSTGTQSPQNVVHCLMLMILGGGDAAPSLHRWWRGRGRGRQRGRCVDFDRPQERPLLITSTRVELIVGIESTGRVIGRG